MIVAGWLWAVFTIIAAFFQTLRNAMQRELTTALGTVGATHVRFLFGFPFALVFLSGLLFGTDVPLPHPGWTFWPWVIDGAFAQVAATALMLMAMGERSFVVTIAYLKTEPIQVAIFGLIFLGDRVSLPMMTAILIATAGVIIMSTKPGGMVGGVATDADRPCLGRHVRAVGGRLPRRNSRSASAQFRHGGHVHAGDRATHAGGRAFALSHGCASRP